MVCKGQRGAEFSRVTAQGKKLFLSVLVLPEGRRENSLCAGWDESLRMLQARRRKRFL